MFAVRYLYVKTRTGLTGADTSSSWSALRGAARSWLVRVDLRSPFGHLLRIGTKKSFRFEYANGRRRADYYGYTAEANI